jgi:hypothetical protein
MLIQYVGATGVFRIHRRALVDLGGPHTTQSELLVYRPSTNFEEALPLKGSKEVVGGLGVFGI